MKKIFYLVSVLVTFCGAFFKLEYWPGASMLLVLGALLLIIQSVMLIPDMNANNPNKTTSVALCLLFVTMALGAIFKVQHWPGATILLLINMAGILVMSVSLALSSKPMTIPRAALLPLFQVILLLVAAARHAPEATTAMPS